MRAYRPTQRDIDNSMFHLKAQGGEVKGDRLTEVVMEATKLPQRDAREVNRVLNRRRLIGWTWEGTFKVVDWDE